MAAVLCVGACSKSKDDPQPDNEHFLKLLNFISWTSSNTDYEYAIIDKVPSTPEYFTGK